MTAEAQSAPASTTPATVPAGPDIHSPDALAHGSPRTLAAALADARAHTLALARALAASLPPTLEVRYLPELDPPMWLLAELAWREDAEIARNPRSRSAILRAGRRTAAAAREVSYAGLGVPRFRGVA